MYNIYMVYIKKYSNRNLSNKVHYFLCLSLNFFFFSGWVPSTFNR